MLEGSVLDHFAQRLAGSSQRAAAEMRALRGLAADRVDFQANLDFVQRGCSEYAFLVIEGIVARFCDTGSGKRQITGIYLPGDAANLGAAVTLPSVVTLQGLTKGQALRIPLECISTLMREQPQMACWLWRESVREAAIACEWMLSLGRRNALERFAHLLCETGWRWRGRAVRDGEQFPLSLSQLQLAEILGLTSVHVNRTARELKERGIASIARKQATVLDWNALSALGDFDPAYLGDLPAAWSDPIGRH